MRVFETVNEVSYNQRRVLDQAFRESALVGDGAVVKREGIATRLITRLNEDLLRR